MKTGIKISRAFTMTEMLTVIAVIGVLLALLFPAIKNSMLKAESAKAQTAISGLQTAFKAYYTEYGKWPVFTSDLSRSNYTYIVDTNFVGLLQGANNHGTLTGGGPGPLSPPYNLLNTSSLTGNARQIRFLEFKKEDLDSALGFLDPWKHPYYCRFDVTYGNDVDDPFTGWSSGINPATKVKVGFVIWSAGPDGRYDDKNTTAGPSELNKDNVKSW